MNFFLINLFVGVLCDQFIEAKEKADPNNYYQVNPYQKQWIEFQSFFFKVKPYKKKLVQENNDKENKFGIIFKKIIGSKIFESFLFLCIVSNIIILSMNYEGQTKDFKDNLEAINYLFTGVFILEAFLKILAMGIKKYFGSLWNIFDFFIVLTSFSEIIIDNELDKGKIDLNFLRIGPQIIRIFRILRVLRAFKLIKRFKTLKKLLATLISAIPSIANIGLLYLMIFYIYAIIGVILFKDVKKGVQINDYNNFSNAGFAILLCFKMVTGENWWEFMFDCYRLYPNCDSSNCGNGKKFSIKLFPCFFFF